MDIPKPIHHYLEDYLDGRLSAEGAEVVSAWVNESSTNAKALAEWFICQVQIHDLESLQDLQEVFGENLSSAQATSSSYASDSCLIPKQESSPDSLSEPSIESPSQANSSTNPITQSAISSPKSLLGYHSRWWALAASLALVSTLGIWSLFESNRTPLVPVALGTGEVTDGSLGEESEANSKELSLPIANAYVGRLSQCEWLLEDTLEEGDELSAGTEVDLLEGQAELIFESGAKVSVRGPCKLTVDGPAEFTLEVGDVSIEASFGFKVTTPSGIAIDLGTAFGVTVDKEGASEVHVFEGEVAFQPVNRSDLASIVLKKDQACRYSMGGISLDEFQANESKFAWRKHELLADDMVPNLAIHDGLVLWLAADRFVETDDQNGVICWRDLLISSNTAAEDALQPAPEFRPLLTSDGLNGKPSIRFGGEGAFLLTPPLYTTNEQTAFIVCSLNNNQPNFQPILNYNGPPQRIAKSLGERIDPGVFQVFFRDADKDGRHAIVGHVYSGWRQQSQVPVVNEVAAFDRVLPNEPLVIAFQHQPADQTLNLHINGEKVASENADVYIGGTSRKLFGQHPIFDNGSMVFHGDLGEVLIYNRALPDSEVQEVSSYLLERFGMDK